MARDLVFLAMSEPFYAAEGKTNRDGQPSQRFRKELIKLGHYVRDADDDGFDVTPELLQHWAATFADMSRNGVRIPMPNMHENEGDADFNRGYVVDMFVDGNALVGVCELIGDDAIAAAARSDVSISSPESFVDGNGVEYEQPILHVALCTNPLVPGLDKFIPIAASRQAKERIMDWKTIQQGLGIGEELTNSNAAKLIVASFETGTKKITELEASLKNATTGKTTAEKWDGTTERREKIAVKPVDRQLIELSVENRDAKLEALVEAGKITPAVRDVLRDTFIGKGDSKALELSLGNGTADVFKSVIAALAHNDPVVLREKTGPQTTLTLTKDADGKTVNVMQAAVKRSQDAFNRDRMSA